MQHYVTEFPRGLVAPRLAQRHGTPAVSQIDGRPAGQLVRIVCAQGVAGGQRSLGESLRQSGFSVSEAATGAEVLRLGPGRPDLVVLEDSLPDQTATQVCRLLRADSATAAIPILLVEGRSGSEPGAVEEADGFLAASAEPREVLAWVRSLLRRQDAPRMESLGRLASGIAHDFNNLLTVIIGHADLLEDSLPAIGEGRTLLNGLQSAARSASQLAAQMLGLVRDQPAAPQSVDLNALVLEVLGILRRVFDTRIEFLVQPGTQVPVIQGVPCHLTQVVLNLCLNARDAMPQGGKLTISTEVLTVMAADSPGGHGPRTGTFVRLRVTDTGAGIPAELLPRIFEPFFTTRPGQGTGLGLATVSRLVRQHQGWIECSSEAGRGSSFDVYLPIS